ncbi:MAG: serine hydrolase domain-containing protein [Nevskiaceae bacterium]
MKIIRWLMKALGGLLAGLVALVVVLLIVMWIADPAVPRNVLFGQPLTQPAAVDKSQPQDPVPGAPRDNIATGGLQAFDEQRLSTAIDYATQMQSVALLIYKDGALVYEKYWPGFSADTRTNPNSMHKAVLALLVGAAIDDGYIPSVDAPASRWIEEWRGDERAAITVRELLQMSSGLEIPVFGTWKSARILFGSNLERGVLELTAAKPHGSNFEYNNASTQVLVTLLERAAGKRYAEYLSSRLWQRLGAADAALWMDRVGGQPRGFCCLFATARDWLRVGRLILEGGRVDGEPLVSEGWVKQMLTPSARNSQFGSNLWLGSPSGTERVYNPYTIKAFHSEPFAAKDIAYIDGFGGQRVYIVPSRNLVIVRTGVSSTDWDDARLPNAVIRALREGG